MVILLRKHPNRIIISYRVVSCLIILVVLINWKIGSLFFVNADLSWKVFLIVISGLFFVLNIMSAVGLFFAQRWGFWLAYGAIIFSTICFDVEYLPLPYFISKNFPDYVRNLMPFLINSLVFIFTAYLHGSLKKTTK
jgi:hypothetical protein